MEIIIEYKKLSSNAIFPVEIGHNLVSLDTPLQELNPGYSPE